MLSRSAADLGKVKAAGRAKAVTVNATEIVRAKAVTANATETVRAKAVTANERKNGDVRMRNN